MKRTIWLTFFGAFLLTAATLLTAAFALFSRQELSEARRGLRNAISAVKISELPVGVEPRRFAQQLGRETERMRVTVLDGRGEVLGDSEADPGQMANHAARPEISGCLASGYGEDIRRSETTGVMTLYVAERIDGDYIIRLAVPIATAYDFLKGVLPIVLILCVLLLLAVRRLSGRLTRRIERPMEEIAQSMGDLAAGREPRRVEESGVFDEFTPFVRNISRLAGTIQRKNEQIVAKQAELDNILRSAQDGIVLLSQGGDVVSINQEACEVLAVPAQPRRKLRELCRSQELMACVDRALERGESSSCELDMMLSRGKYLRAFVNPAVRSGQPAGAVVFLCDVTGQKKLERMRTDFVANVSHELRSPMTSIKGFAELLAEGMVASEEKRRDYLRRIVAVSDRLLQIINDILALSELENREKEVSAGASADLRAAAEEAAALLEERAREAGITLAVEGQAEAAAEFGPVRDMLFNLVDNGVKYGRSGGQVRVRLWEREGKAWCEVSDNGIGIATEDLERVFERFYRVDKARTSLSNSTGLGLAIVKHTAQKYGGGVQAQSQPGIGTTMTVWLPRAEGRE